MSTRARKTGRRAATKTAVKAPARQQIPTGSVSEVLATLPAMTNVGPVHGPDLDAPLTIAWRTEVPATPRARFSDRDVEAAVDFIHSTGLVEFFSTRISAGKKKPGRRPAPACSRSWLPCGWPPSMAAACC